MAVESVSLGGAPNATTAQMHRLVPHGASQEYVNLAAKVERMEYLSAERMGPRDVYDLVDEYNRGTVGARGEFAAGTLYAYRDLDVVPIPMSPQPDALKLLNQVRGWLAHLFPGSDLQMQKVPYSAHVTLGFRTSISQDFYMPQNVGFGLTQVFPILVAALAAAQGGIVAIENPEVHLHPAGQAEIARFLAAVAASGRQVIVESHSDHVLSGIRRAVKDGLLPKTSVAIHFFRPRSDEGAQIISPQVDQNGDLDTWPEGFFDQFDKDASYFAGWSD